MTTIQDAAAKGPAPVRRSAGEWLGDLRYLLAIAACLAGLLLIFAYAVAPAHADGNHNCGSCGTVRGDMSDTRSGTYRGNPGGFYATQGSITGNGHTLGSIAAAIGNAIGRTLSAIGSFMDGIRYHYQDTPGQYGIAASPA